MTMNVLLVGRTHDVLDGAQSQIEMSDVELSAATNAEEVATAFSSSGFNHVFMGAGIALEERVRVVKAVYEASDTTTIHLKDVASGPEGFLPFVKTILSALSAEA